MEDVAERAVDPARRTDPPGVRVDVPAESTAPRTFRFTPQRLVLFLMGPAVLLGLTFLFDGRSLPKGGIVFVGGVLVTWFLLIIGAAGTLLLALLTGRRIKRRQGVPRAVLRSRSAQRTPRSDRS